MFQTRGGIPAVRLVQLENAHIFSILHGDGQNMK